MIFWQIYFIMREKIWDSSSLITADKWQLHSITFQREHYSRNIENGETFSCAFQIWDDIWNEQTLWCPGQQWEANEIQF